MRSLSNMGLWMWDQSEDDYNHEQLASNFARLDSHDHTNGRGVQLTTQSIAAGSIDKTLLAAEAVQLSNLSAEIQAKLKGEITTEGIASEAVTAVKLATNSVTTIKILAEAVTESKLSAAVQAKLAEATTGKTELTTLKGIAVTTANVGTNAVTPTTVGSYTAQTARTAGTEYEPSSTRPTFVILDITGTTNTAIIGELIVGGIKIAQIGIGRVAETMEITISFVCPHGQKWQIANPFGIVTLKSSYLPL